MAARAGGPGVSANLDWVDLATGRADASFAITITHAGGHSHLSATKVNRLAAKELRLMDALSSYVSAQTDVQAQAVFAGRRPVDDPSGWGYEIPELWGTLSTADGSVRVPSAQGSYSDYYARFAAAVDHGAPQTVPATEAVGTLAVLNAARPVPRKASRSRSDPVCHVGPVGFSVIMVIGHVAAFAADFDRAGGAVAGLDRRRHLAFV